VSGKLLASELSPGPINNHKAFSLGMFYERDKVQTKVTCTAEHNNDSM